MTLMRFFHKTSKTQSCHPSAGLTATQLTRLDRDRWSSGTCGYLCRDAVCDAAFLPISVDDAAALIYGRRPLTSRIDRPSPLSKVMSAIVFLWQTRFQQSMAITYTEGVSIRPPSLPEGQEKWIKDVLELKHWRDKTNRSHIISIRPLLATPETLSNESPTDEESWGHCWPPVHRAEESRHIAR